jgi:hypothetical protein
MSNRLIAAYAKRVEPLQYTGTFAVEGFYSWYFNLRFLRPERNQKVRRLFEFISWLILDIFHLLLRTIPALKIKVPRMEDGSGTC